MARSSPAIRATNRIARLTEFWNACASLASKRELAAGISTTGCATSPSSRKGIAVVLHAAYRAWFGLHARVGLEQAAFYSTGPLRETLSSLVDFDYLNRRRRG